VILKEDGEIFPPENDFRACLGVELVKDTVAYYDKNIDKRQKQHGQHLSVQR
jgi:hypothetical protein